MSLLWVANVRPANSTHSLMGHIVCFIIISIVYCGPNMPSVIAAPSRTMDNGHYVPLSLHGMVIIDIIFIYCWLHRTLSQLVQDMPVPKVCYCGEMKIKVVAAATRICVMHMSLMKTSAKSIHLFVVVDMEVGNYMLHNVHPCIIPSAQSGSGNWLSATSFSEP